MRRAFLSILAGLLALTGFGQIAPDIAKGTSAEDVIRSHGWPKGKSVADGRESWLYDRFQVLFQQGKVVSVSYIATSGPEPFQFAPPSGVTTAEPGLPKPASREKQAAPPSPVRPSTSPAIPMARPARPPPTSDFLVVPPNRSRDESQTTAHSTTLWITGGIAAAGILLGLLILSVNRRDPARKLSEDLLEQKRRETFRKRKSWEDEVAEKLREADRSTRGVAGEQPVPQPPRIVGELTLELLRKLEWKRFELLTILYLGTTGVRAQATCTGADGGVDAHLFRPGEETPFSYVQCKAWGLRPVDVKPVRELFGVMAADGVREGYLFATGEFTPDARAFVAGRQLRLVSGGEIIAQFEKLPEDVRERILTEVTSGDFTTPTCPRCDVKLVLRDNQKNRTSFWGCRNFPHCHYTLRAKPQAHLDPLTP